MFLFPPISDYIFTDNYQSKVWNHRLLRIKYNVEYNYKTKTLFIYPVKVSNLLKISV